MQKSPAHLRLLKEFLHPQVAKDFKSGYWKRELGEDPQKAIQSFLDAGLLVHADLGEYLAYKFKVTELKSMLKQRSLPTSGRKSDLVSRLVQADPEWMQEAATKDLAYKLTVTELKSMLRQRSLPTSGRKSDLISRLVQADPEGVKNVIAVTVLQCSEQGREIVDQYSAREKKKKKIRPFVVILLIIVSAIFILLLIISGQKTTLTCKQVEPSSPVTCELVGSGLLGSTVREFELQRAKIEWTNDETYHIVLLTSSGNVRLYTSIFTSEGELLFRINDFVQNPEETPLTYQADDREIAYIFVGIIIPGVLFVFVKRLSYYIKG